MEAVGFVVLAVIIQKVVEHVRSWIPIDGVGVFLFSAVLGGVAAAGTDVRVVADLLPDANVAAWFDTLITGFGLGAGAGFFADISGRSGTSQPPIVRVNVE